MAFTLTIPRRRVSAWSAIGSWPAAPLSGIAERHPVASPAPAPIGSALSYEGDIERGRRFMTLVLEGYAGSLAEAAIRFAISHPAMGTILVGMASLQQREGALAAVRKGPLPRAARDRIAMLQKGFAGEVALIRLPSTSLLARARRVRDQRQHQRGPKVYSLHAPEEECIGKGKAHRPYEFGVKISVATTRRHANDGA